MPLYMEQVLASEPDRNASKNRSIQELTPPHLSTQANVPSPAQKRKETMTRSQYFHEMAAENEKLYGGQTMAVDSEQRSSFQWPYHPRQAPASNAYANLNPYETIPPIRR